MKKIRILFLCLILVLLFAGCGEKEEAKMQVYYVNADGNGLLFEEHVKMGTGEALEKVKTQSALPLEIRLEKYEIHDGRLRLYYNDAYYDMKKGTEVLFRAAIVQTMVQMDEVTFVSFYVDDEPLKDAKGNAVGLMQAEDFVQNTGASIDSYQTTDLTLYLGNKDGTGLKKVTKTHVRYNANTSKEKLVVEQLMKKQSTIPKTTKLLGISIKEGICYVNFDSKFEQDSYDLDPNVTIYSIVNSIIANGNVTKVQILIDGASDVLYKNIVDLGRPLEWNEGLIKE